MPGKWTPAQHKKFQATIKAKAKQKATQTFSLDGIPDMPIKAPKRTTEEGFKVVLNMKQAAALIQFLLSK
jgi:hypothetical protein